jgi:hypothetical protein
MKTMSRRPILILALLLATSLTTQAIASTNQESMGGISIRIAEISGSEQNNPLAKLYFVDHMQPSQVMTRRIEVSNTTQVVQSVIIYPGAAQQVKENFVAASDRRENELTSWITVTPEQVQLLPGGYATINVTFSIPSNVSSGTRYGVIWAETTSSGDISIVNRVGIRIMMPIGEVKEVIPIKVTQIEKIQNWIKRNLYQTLVFAVLLAVNLAVLGRRLVASTVIEIRKRRAARKRRNAPTLSGG